MKFKSKVETKGLDEAIKNLEGLKTHGAEIGVYGGTEENGSDLVEVASVHENGSVDGRIPPRPFLSMPCIMYRNDIRETYARGLKRYLTTPQGWEKVLGAVCHKAEEIVNEAFDTGGFSLWPPLKEVTVARKGSRAILIHTGNLRRNVRTKITKKIT
jgi:hypothetical protein